MTVPETTLHALSSSKVVLGNEVVEATVVYSQPEGKIVLIIRKDETSTPTEELDANAASDEELPEYYDAELEALGVSPDNHRDIGDLVLMPGLVDAHVHLNEVCLFLHFFFFGSKYVASLRYLSRPMAANGIWK